MPGPQRNEVDFYVERSGPADLCLQGFAGPTPHKSLRHIIAHAMAAAIRNVGRDGVDPVQRIEEAVGRAGAGIGTCGNLDRSFMTADAIGGKRGMRQDALAQLDAVFPGVHRLAAHYQARKIELKFMAVMRRVRTFDFAELASVAKVDDALLLCRRHRSYVAVVAIDRVEQRRERRAKIEAQT